MAKQTEILFICGSPRSHTSEELMGLIERGVRESGAKAQCFRLSQKHIAPCTGCGSCSKNGVCVLANKTKDGKLIDDYLELCAALQRTHAVAVISPLFFAGPPAQLKALYDRFQPFWARRYVLGEKPVPKRPAQLFILGGGGDAHGYEPFVSISKSALAVAGFAVEKVQNFIGYKARADVEPIPSEDVATNMAFGELAHLRKALAIQTDFEERAVAAGGAFARFVRKSLEKLELQAELRQVEAEIAELKAIEPVILEPMPRATDAASTLEHIEAGFEALKLAARSVEKYVEHDLTADAAVRAAALAANEAAAADAKQVTQNPSSAAADAGTNTSANTSASQTASVSLDGDGTNTSQTKQNLPQGATLPD
ncbi:MAG: flavodoxin family protein [Coriobacteriales bacterium]|jgi:multimeric flavodoxin WrbA|nr:flavodoxin family protein [Coriobacteriales bacterium]